MKHQRYSKLNQIDERTYYTHIFYPWLYLFSHLFIECVFLNRPHMYNSFTFSFRKKNSLYKVNYMLKQNEAIKFQNLLVTYGVVKKYEFGTKVKYFYLSIYVTGNVWNQWILFNSQVMYTIPGHIRNVEIVFQTFLNTTFPRKCMYFLGIVYISKLLLGNV